MLTRRPVQEDADGRPRRRYGAGVWIRQGLAAVAVLCVGAVALGGEDTWHAECAYVDYDCATGQVCTMRPGLDQVFNKTGRYPFRVKTNAAGFRGAAWPKTPKEPGVTRVAVLGSSPVFGLGVEDDETMPVRLAAALERLAPGRRFEVLNFGLPENYLASQLLTYRLFVRALEPDVAVFVQPDLVHVVDMNQRLLQLDRSRLLRMLLRWDWGRALVNRYQYLSMALSNRLSWAGTAVIQERFAPVVEDVQRRGLRVVFFNFQDMRPLDAALPPGLRARGVNAGVTPEAYLAGPWVLAGDGHPNPAGQAHFAEVLAPVVLEEVGP